MYTLYAAIIIAQSATSSCSPLFFEMTVRSNITKINIIRINISITTFTR